MKTGILKSAAIYLVAGVLVWYATRGVSWGGIIDSVRHATLWLLILTSFFGFLCWFVGETVLFSRLFSYFHGHTKFRELLPTVATVYFLQIANSLVAAAGFALFLHRRKRVPWITSGCTLMFQAYVDIMLLALMSLVAIRLVPSSPIHPGLDYAASVLGLMCLITGFWLFFQPRSNGGFGKWLYERPSMMSFRRARPSHYLCLLAIRLAIFIGAGFALYGQFRSFHVNVPLVQVLALTPFIMAVGNAPLSPAGIGTTQLVFLLGFSHFAPKSQILAVSLAVTAFNLMFRIPMGFATGSTLGEELTFKHEDEPEEEPVIRQRVVNEG